MAGKGNVGTSLGGIEFSPERKKRDAARRKRQEERWAARSGEVRVSRVDPEESAENPAGLEGDKAEEG